MSHRRIHGLALALALLAAPAAASFHEMQIEQVIGGLCGDTTKQAVQLRMRVAGQMFVSGKMVVAHDADGTSTVPLITIPANVGVGTAGSRILLATSQMAAAAGITPDFTLAQAIPASDLEAGKVTFEDPSFFGTLWALAWGGAAYTDADTGATINDADGIFSPVFPAMLPWTNDRTLRFQGAAGAASTNNAADYAVSTATATLTNNAGTSVALPACLFGDGFATGDLAGWSVKSP